jgi:hypothetical protein
MMLSSFLVLASLVSETGHSMCLSVCRATILLIGSLLKELLSVVRADAKPQAANRRYEKGVDVKSCFHIAAIDRGPEQYLEEFEVCHAKKRLRRKSAYGYLPWL